MKTSKKTAKTTVKSKTAAKAVAVAKSAKPATRAQQATRSMAAYKAHITRQNQIIEASKSAAVKKDARAAIATITANMKAA